MGTRTECSSLLQYAATDRQREILEVVGEEGSHTKAAKKLGINRRAVDRTVARVRRQAAKQGWSPDHDFTHTVPDGFQVKGVSTLYDETGEMRAQWVKADQQKERLEAIYREVLEAMKEDLPREKKVKKGKGKVGGELLNFYPICDAHLGMYAWGEETGADWDIKIAEETLVRWLEAAVDSSPDAEVGLLGLLGDLLHTDGLEALTPEHGNVLDADSRFAKTVRVAIRVLRRMVRTLLEKHKRVHIICASGNHDPSGGVWLREWLAAFYEEEPRVTVDQSPDLYYAYQWGDTLLCIHHGDKRDAKKVDSVFAQKFRGEFGATKYAYGHIGHKHHSGKVETNLMVVENHPTLAAPDAFASSNGYAANRSASVISYHSAHGEVGRVTLTPEMIGA